MAGRWARGRIEQALRAHRPRRYPIPGLRPAAVLVALFEREDKETMLWLLRRPSDGTAHGGQVALPGGKREPGEQLEQTALREAQEEIGLAPQHVEVLGALDDLVTITRYRVTPFVGWMAAPFEPRPSATEVARVFAAPLSKFAEAPDRHEVTLAGFTRSVEGKLVDREMVWGATFAILRRLVGLVG